MGLCEDILGYDDRPKTKVEIPEWGSPDVYICRMGGDDREEWDSWVRANKEAPKGWRAKLLILTLVDASGEPVFTDDHLESLNRKSSAVLSRLWDMSADLNGLSEKAAKEAEKNS